MSEAPTSALKQDLEDLAAFRAALRRYLKFSERVVRQHGLFADQISTQAHRLINQRQITVAPYRPTVHV